MKRYLSPDENTGGGSGTETVVEKSGPNFEALSQGMFEVGFNPKAIAEEKKVEQVNKEEVEKTDPPALDLGANDNPDKKDVVEKVDTVVEDGKETPADKADVIEKLPEELSLESVVSTEVEEKPFISMGKELFNAELADDSWESFSEATKKALVEAEERGKAVSIQKELAALPVEAQVDFLLLRSGLTREEINNPTGKIDQYLSMSNIDLVKEDLKLKFQGSPESVIEKEVEILVEKGLVDHEAEKLKAGLKQERVQVIEGRKELAQRVATEYEASQKVQKANEIESMNKAFNTVKDFMGLPVTEASRATLAKQYSDGNFDNIFNDPKEKAEFILFKKFGETAMKIIRNNAFTEGREKVTKHLSNIPNQVHEHNSKASHKISAKDSSGFASLKNIFDE